MNNGSANPDDIADDGIRSRWGFSGSASLSRLAAGFIDEMNVREESVIELSGGVRSQGPNEEPEASSPEATAPEQDASSDHPHEQPGSSDEQPATDPDGVQPAAAARASVEGEGDEAGRPAIPPEPGPEVRAASIGSPPDKEPDAAPPVQAPPKAGKSASPPPVLSPEPKKRTSPALAAGWFDEVFDKTWMKLEPKSANARARSDVRFLIKHCGVPRGGSVFDVGCGTGRHVMELASAGYKPVGLDTSAPFLERAVQDANDKNLEIQFVKGDMRSISFPPTFSAVTFFRTTFGYFDDTTNRDVLRRVASSLVKGGQLVIDTVNRDWVVATGASRLWWEQRDLIIMEDVDFKHRDSRLTVERTIVGEDLPKTKRTISIRLYTLRELEEMFDDVGLELVDVTGSPSHPGVYLGACNPRVIIRARKAVG